MMTTHRSLALKPRVAMPRICHVPAHAWHAPEPLPASRRGDLLQGWHALAQRVAASGFDHILCGSLWQPCAIAPHMVDDFHRLLPSLRHAHLSTGELLFCMSRVCRQAGLKLWLDIPPSSAQLEDRLTELAESLHFLAGTGIAGFRILQPQSLPGASWRAVIADVLASDPGCGFTAWTPGLAPGQVSALAHSGFSAVYDSLAWWNFQDDWLLAEHERLQAVGKVIATLAPPDEPSQPGHDDTVLRRLMRCGAEFCQGMLLPVSLLPAAPDPDAAQSGLTQLNARLAGRPSSPRRLRLLAAGTTPYTAILSATADTSVLVVVNPSTQAPAPVDWDLLRARAGNAIAPSALRDHAILAPAEVLALPLEPVRTVRTLPSAPRPGAEEPALAQAMRAPRIVIQDLQPGLPVSSHLVKRLVGERVEVGANIFIDGHDVLGADLLWRSVDSSEWTRVAMVAQGNDAWTADFTPARMGRHEYTVEAWRDVFGTYRNELQKKHAAGLDLALELREGRDLLALAGLADTFADDVQTLLSDELATAMRIAGPREFPTRLQPPQALSMERRQAGFASWYEMFPRSQSATPGRHGTLRDVIARLPYVRELGFDVLYFPPIHPIGRRNRKGRNNSLSATAGDPGSPYAIGAAEGGHDALHPELGTLDDFRALLRAARAHGLEIALDFAIQCAPDHPWLAQHPDWYAWRADGSLRYAENPPKKYEDIVNVDFYGRDERGLAGAGTPALWLAWRDVVLFWVNEGVRTFRVDNPHTKPLPFWEWLIADVQGRHPDTVFLSEAFTRPNMMYHLAKIGFSQSYTYFTWRNTRAELESYLREIGAGPVAEFFRPNFFVNTPDINPWFLQTSGRPGFLIRAALACTLSGLWGMYNGFEMCEGRPVPGKEEYLDSEKYQLRHWDWDQPGHIRTEIAQLNRIRRHNPALHSPRGIEFLPSEDEQVLFYAKATPQRDNVLLIAVSLDPHIPRQSRVELPLWRFGLPDDGHLPMYDLLRERAFAWHGKHQVLRLDPEQPYGIWRVAAPAVT